MGVAHASTQSASPLGKDASGSASKGRTSNAEVGTSSASHPRGSSRANDPLLLDQSAPSMHQAAPPVEAIKSLATGAAPLNPWFPERGAIGVRVKVTW